MTRLWRARNWWIAILLLLANGVAWLGASGPVSVEYEPRLAPEIAEIRERVIAKDAVGERFGIVADETMVGEGLAWFLERHPEAPFSHGQVEIDPQGVTGRGMVHMFGLRTSVYGRARLSLREGVPIFHLEQLGIAGLPLPPWMVNAVQAEVETQLDFTRWDLPLYFTRLELREGEAVIEGYYR